MTRCHRHTRYRLASCAACRAVLHDQAAAAGATPAGVLLAVPTGNLPVRQLAPAAPAG